MGLLVEQLMPQSRVKLQGAVGHAAALELVVGLVHTAAHTAHRIILTGDQQNGDLAVHFVQMGEPLVEADALEHLIEQSPPGSRTS